jgi:hypothetical protein
MKQNDQLHRLSGTYHKALGEKSFLICLTWMAMMGVSIGSDIANEGKEYYAIFGGDANGI